MLGNLIGPEINELIETRNFSAIRQLLETLPAADQGEIISELPEEIQAIVFRLLPQSNATEVLEYLGPDEQERLLEEGATSLCSFPTRLCLHFKKLSSCEALVHHFSVSVSHPWSSPHQITLKEPFPC
jgi:hypothetical protein